MTKERILGRTADVGALLALLAILGFYATRVAMPALLYAGDEGAYLIRALFPPDAIARHPLVPELNNSVFLGLVRLVSWLPGPDLAWLRLVDAASYVGGLLIVHRVATHDLPAARRWAFLILALAFPFYRFVVTVMPEGLYVLGLGLLVAVTAGLYRTRPALHGVIAGGLTAGLTLVKPHGLAVAAAFAALAVVDALLGGRRRMLPLRLAAFAAAFFAVGAGLHAAAGGGATLTFFLNPYYERALGLALPSDAPAAGLLALAAMAGAVLVLAGPPIVIALADMLSRRRVERPFRLEGRDVAFLLLLLSLLATLAMVAIYAMKVSGDPGEAKRLWGRYFEFFAPLLWLAAAPYIADGALTLRTRLACAGAVLAGLAALLAGFAGGIVLFPWDATALTAFFRQDPVRAPVQVWLAYRLLAIGATVLAAGALMLRLGPVRIWTGLFLVLAVLSTWLDRRWMGAIFDKREAFHNEAMVAGAIVREPGRDAVVVTDNNDAHLSFLQFEGVQILVAPAGDPTPPEAAGFDTLVVVAPATPATAGWRPRYEGAQLSVYERAASP